MFAVLVVKIYPSECFLYLRHENDDAGPVQIVSVFLRSYHPTVQVLQCRTWVFILLFENISVPIFEKYKLSM